MTTALLVIGLSCAVAALWVAVVRQEREIAMLRKWRHDVATPALVRGEELYARTHDKVGLPSIEDIQARELRARARIGELPS
jgi:hypothetical protein